MVAEVTEYAWYALHEPLRAFLRKRVRDEETAEDLLQEVWLRSEQAPNGVALFPHEPRLGLPLTTVCWQVEPRAGERCFS